MMPGYTVAGTLGHHVMSEPTEITTQAGESVAVLLQIEYISFSAHSDYAQTSEFIEATKPKHVVLVHGAEEEMRRLRSALQQFGHDRLGAERFDVLMPRNCQTVQLSFHAHKVAKALGALAAAQPADGAEVCALLVRRDFGYQLVADADIAEHTSLTAVSIMQRPRLPFHGTHAALRAALEQLFPLTETHAVGVDAPMGGAGTKLAPARARAGELRVCVAGGVNVVASADECVAQLEWASSAANDLIADAVASVVLRLETEAIVAQTCAAPTAPLAAAAASDGSAHVRIAGPRVKAEPGLIGEPAQKRLRAEIDPE
jgi:cleavage and polyadenylation specificity factor subunit 3